MNGDYSFKFRTNGMPTKDRGTNECLNRIAEIITNARNETVEHETVRMKHVERYTVKLFTCEKNIAS